MDKEQSTIIKGIAILMMLWYHLFGIDGLEQACTPLIYLNGKALVAYLSNATYPVTFFLILSGYGLTCIFKQKKLNVINQSKRLLKLYIHYWVILLVFVGLSVFVKPGMYAFDFLHILGNVTAIRCNYNGEAWFLFPYALLSLSAPITINYVYHLHHKKKIIVTAIIYAIMFIAAKYLSNRLPENVVLNIIFIQYCYYVILLFYFTLGILLYRFLENKKQRNKNINYLLPIIILMGIKSMFKVTIADGLYAFTFIILFLKLSLHPYIKNGLHHLGRYSMPMWLTHTFFCVYLFPEFIYGFKYPLLIFTALVIITYLTSVPIIYISNFIITKIKL